MYPTKPPHLARGQLAPTHSQLLHAACNGARQHAAPRVATEQKPAQMLGFCIKQAKKTNRELHAERCDTKLKLSVCSINN